MGDGSSPLSIENQGYFVSQPKFTLPLPAKKESSLFYTFPTRLNKFS